MPIELRVWPFDHSHPAADGELTDYYNAGWRCELIVDGRVYALSRARDYPEEVNLRNPAGAHADKFVRGLRRLRRGPADPGGMPYDDLIFVKAARWLLDQPGIEQLRVFLDDIEHANNPFVPVDPERLR